MSGFIREVGAGVQSIGEFFSWGKQVLAKGWKIEYSPYKPGPADPAGKVDALGKMLLTIPKIAYGVVQWGLKHPWQAGSVALLMQGRQGDAFWPFSNPSPSGVRLGLIGPLLPQLEHPLIPKDFYCNDCKGGPAFEIQEGQVQPVTVQDPYLINPDHFSQYVEVNSLMGVIADTLSESQVNPSAVQVVPFAFNNQVDGFDALVRKAGETDVKVLCLSVVMPRTSQNISPAQIRMEQEFAEKYLRDPVGTRAEVDALHASGEYGPAFKPQLDHLFNKMDTIRNFDGVLVVPAGQGSVDLSNPTEMLHPSSLPFDNMIVVTTLNQQGSAVGESVPYGAPSLMVALPRVPTPRVDPCQGGAQPVRRLDGTHPLPCNLVREFHDMDLREYQAGRQVNRGTAGPTAQMAAHVAELFTVYPELPLPQLRDIITISTIRTVPDRAGNQVPVYDHRTALRHVRGLANQGRNETREL